ncbi:DUF2231 domain-containing protein [Fischerella thermalis CCMEE 5273]|uniref:DUF2231 domain-containing protein n=1 Tax=Chlorogloeopsis fritschii PCC 6912 TaxID=211165 RepID=A0A433NLH6_CHLFR|nr:DUF2231 domain-containing protein [Chlorogloeopsis fritschii]PMB09849.1 DUF2231 domain-containing protein [Fischerella thermalis CCMEE 5273]RUR83753.1 hypothetical protein PCC6912_19960 [Chlorogloeopsis fritschii PCC 6912]
MPPIHPAIVHFPIALVTLSVVADGFGYLMDNASLQATGWWALVGALIGAAIAVPAGLFDMRRERLEHTAHQHVHTHMRVGFTLAAAIAGLTIWRWLIQYNPRFNWGWGYLVVAVVVLGLTLFQGWLGSELVYSNGVGVAPTGQGTEPANEARRRIARVAGGSNSSDRHSH